MTVQVHPDAESEFRDAFVWKKGLGAEVVLCVDEAVELHVVDAAIVL